MTLPGTHRVDLGDGRARWDGRHGRLSWFGWRSFLSREASVTVRVPGRRQVRVTVQADWLKPGHVDPAEGRR